MPTGSASASVAVATLLGAMAATLEKRLREINGAFLEGSSDERLRGLRCDTAARAAIYGDNLTRKESPAARHDTAVLNDLSSRANWAQTRRFLTGFESVFGFFTMRSAVSTIRLSKTAI